VLIAGLALISGTSHLFAQSTLGTIIGTVTGDDGGPLSGVRVTASAALPQAIGVSGVLATGPTQGVALSTLTGSFVSDLTSANQPHALIGVSTQVGHFYPVLNAGINATRQNQKLLIHLHTKLELKIVSTYVALADSMGQLLPDSYSSPFRIDAAVPQVPNRSVTGSR